LDWLLGSRSVVTTKRRPIVRRRRGSTQVPQRPGFVPSEYSPHGDSRPSGGYFRTLTAQWTPADCDCASTGSAVPGDRHALGRPLVASRYRDSSLDPAAAHVRGSLERASRYNRASASGPEIPSKIAPRRTKPPARRSGVRRRQSRSSGRGRVRGPDPAAPLAEGRLDPGQAPNSSVDANPARLLLRIGVSLRR
jgi:hypothetical protein